MLARAAAADAEASLLVINGPDLVSEFTGPGLVVLGATNRPQQLDPALRRPGRFERELE
ncbi:uncharacterized protein HaLaN_06198, partial [Haematococcus lacustris]